MIICVKFFDWSTLSLSRSPKTEKRNRLIGFCDIFLTSFSPFRLLCFIFGTTLSQSHSSRAATCQFSANEGYRRRRTCTDVKNVLTLENPKSPRWLRSFVVWFRFDDDDDDRRTFCGRTIRQRRVNNVNWCIFLFQDRLTNVWVRIFRAGRVSSCCVGTDTKILQQHLHTFATCKKKPVSFTLMQFLKRKLVKLTIF